MKKIIYVLFCFLFFLSFLDVWCQNKNTGTDDYAVNGNSDIFLGIVDVIPPCGEASGLGKYGDYPVSLSTGLPTIEIPLFEIRTKRINLPLSLSYHASGIKVEELSSSVGLGWVLNAGGAIAVTVKDLVDASDGFHLNSTSSDLTAMNPTDRTSSFYLLNDGHIDRESDIYSYNFNGYSGQFYYNSSGDIVSLSNDGLSIDKDFNITTPDGIRYCFHRSEISFLITGPTAYNSQGRQRDGGKSYYLTSIEDLMTGEKILFHYDDITLTGSNAYKHHFYSPNFNGMEHIISSPDVLCRAELIPNHPSYCELTTDMVVALSGITFPGGKVEFTNATDCEDLRVYRVSDIRLYGGHNLKESVKHIKFGHSYFLSGGSDSDASYKRLRLDSVTINSVDKYSFTYNSTPLPSFFHGDPYSVSYNFSCDGCFDQDEWGYYNGKNNRTLFKNLPELYSLYAGDRSSDTFFMKACSLEEIIYPTGGKTRFYFESNRGRMFDNGNAVVGGLRIKNILNYADKDSPSPIRTTSYSYSVGELSPLYEHYRDWSYTQTYDYVNDPTCASSLRRHPTYYGTSPLVSNRFHNGTIVYYKTVTETVSDGNTTSQERNIYSYDIDEPFYGLPPSYGGGLSTCTSPLSGGGRPQYSFYSHIRNYSSGHLLRHQIYKADVNGSFVPQREITHLYGTFGKRLNVIGIVANPETKYVVAHCNTERKDNIHQYFDIIAESGVKKILKTTTIDYFDNGSNQRSEVIYAYDSCGTHYFVTSESFTNSMGNTVVTETTYPSDYAHSSSGGCPSIYSQMTSKNMLNFPIEQITKVGNKITSGIISEYSIGDGSSADECGGALIYPCKTHILTVDNPVSDYIPLTVTTAHSTTTHNLDPRYRIEAEYYYSYPYGKLKSFIIPKNKDTTIILWSYKNQYPVAEIKNAAISAVEYAVIYLLCQSPTRQN